MDIAGVAGLDNWLSESCSMMASYLGVEARGPSKEGGKTWTSRMLMIVGSEPLAVLDLDGVLLNLAWGA